MGIEILGIKKFYKQKEVLKDVSLEVEAGQCIGILGSNGCGKTTLLSILAGVIKGDGGSFRFQGEDLFKDRKRSAEVLGYVPQGNPLIGELSGLDNLRLWYNKADLEKELEDGVLAMLGIGDFLKTPVRKMSGGMKKRLSIGCAVAGKPKALLMDEPSAALDFVCKERIYNYLNDFKAQGGIILLTTHDVQELSLCDSCYILKEGCLRSYQYDGNVHKLVGCL